MSNKKMALRMNKPNIASSNFAVYNRKIQAFVLALANPFLQRLFPVKCVGCGKEYTYLCYECASQIELIRTDTCPKCGKISLNSKFCRNCKSRDKLYLDAVLVGSRYDIGPLKEMLYLFKYEGITALTTDLAEIAIQRVKGRVNPHTIVVPVPIGSGRFKKRGYNQAELLARNISKTLCLSGGNALNRVRETKSQVGLTREERAENVKNSFVCADKSLIKDKEVVLVDDVATTFATLNECAKVLRAAGAKKVTGLVVAKRL